MNTPSNLKYAKSDEWFDPTSGAIGISDYAQNQLSDIVFVELLVDEGEETRQSPLAMRRDLPRSPHGHLPSSQPCSG